MNELHQKLAASDRKLPPYVQRMVEALWSEVRDLEQHIDGVETGGGMRPLAAVLDAQALKSAKCVASEHGAVVVVLGGDAVKDGDVEVKVGIEGKAEAAQEADGAELGVARTGRAAAAQRGADTAEQNAQHVAGQGCVVGQEVADPLRQGRRHIGGWAAAAARGT